MRELLKRLAIILFMVFIACDGIMETSHLFPSGEGTLGLTIYYSDPPDYISVLVSIDDTTKRFYFPDRFFDPVVSPDGRKAIVKSKEFGVFDARALAVYYFDGDSVVYPFDEYGEYIMGDGVLWSPEGDRIYYYVPSSTFWLYCYYDFKIDEQVIYSYNRSAEDFLDKNTILTFYRDSSGFYRYAKMNREGIIFTDISNPYLVFSDPDDLNSFVYRYSAPLGLYAGITEYQANGRTYYGIITTDETGRVFNILTDDKYIDMNPIFGFQGKSIYFERADHNSITPNDQSWIMRYNLTESRKQTIFPIGSFNGAIRLKLFCFSQNVVVD